MNEHEQRAISFTLDTNQTEIEQNKTSCNDIKSPFENKDLINPRDKHSAKSPKPVLIFLKSENGTNPTISIPEFGVLGRNSSSQICIDDTLASDRHARIEKRGDSYFLRDLNTPTGTFVNNTRIVEIQLSDGDILRIGLTELQYKSPTLRTDKTSCFLISQNEVLQKDLETLENAAKTNFPIPLLGDSGTGKDILAQKIHAASGRRGPLISVNCSALAETLIESELFGHIRGSFTGAISDRKGAFEAARGGTLFLDEIGDLTYSLQAKLLRALENSEVRPVGSDKNIRTDVRIIAATHQSLHNNIQEGSFRADLYFRLNVVSITLPNLKDRLEDFETLLYIFAREMRVRFSHDSIQKLKKYSWPGNIRELKNLITRAAAFFPNRLIELQHIDRLIDKNFHQKEIQEVETNIFLNPKTPIIKDIERQMIVKRLTANRGNQRRTASDLGLPKSTLHDRLRAYDIDPQAFKSNRIGRISTNSKLETSSQNFEEKTETFTKDFECGSFQDLI